jgi:aminoglycoside 6'-N-acetyltransferase I
VRDAVGGGRSAVGGPRGDRRDAPDGRADHPPPTANLSVRPATIADLATVVELRVALLHEHSENPVYGRLRPDLPERARRLFASQLESEQEVTFLAERTRGERRAVVGILRCVDAAGSPLLFPARYAYVASVYVVPEERQGGVLHALLDAAERWSRDRGLREMRLHNAADNEVAGRAWQALGFEVVEVLRIKALD